MNWVPEEERAMILQIARDSNCWIKYGKSWYTPDEFDEINRSGTGRGIKHVEIRNPVAALREGRSKLLKLVTNEKFDWQIKNDAMLRLFAFEDKIRLKEYAEKPDQKDNLHLNCNIPSGC